jgi:putative copper export protein
MKKMRPLPTNPVLHRQFGWLWFVLATVVLLIIVPALPLPYRDTKVLIAAIGGLWGLAFFLQNGHKEDAKFMKELFEYFNKRYDD